MRWKKMDFSRVESRSLDDSTAGPKNSAFQDGRVLITWFWYAALKYVEFGVDSENNSNFVSAENILDLSMMESTSLDFSTVGSR